MVRVGFIGAGGIARRHMEHVAQVEEATVAAVCDLNEQRAGAAAEPHGCPAFTDWRRMYDSIPFDAMWISVPPHAHEGQEEAAAKRGWHVMVEKPVANSLDRAYQIEDAVTKAGVVAAAGYQWRYRADIDTVRQKLDPRSIALVKGYWCGNFPGVAWWRRRDQAGGQFVEQTTHLVDLARYLVGEFAEVAAVFTNHTMRDVESFDVWDAGAVVARLENGATASFCNTCALPFTHYVGLHLLGRNGAIEIGADSVRIQEPGKLTELRAGDDPYLTQARAFIEAIRGRGPVRSTYPDAVKTLRVTLAATEAALTREVKRLD
jgi:myo-inositol 2-dehydrogenase/D-chiro-inositol 1-dehydrogenase